MRVSRSIRTAAHTIPPTPTTPDSTASTSGNQRSDSGSSASKTTPSSARSVAEEKPPSAVYSARSARTSRTLRVCAANLVGCRRDSALESPGETASSSRPTSRERSTARATRLLVLMMSTETAFVRMAGATISESTPNGLAVLCAAVCSITIRPRRRSRAASSLLPEVAHEREQSRHDQHEAHDGRPERRRTPEVRGLTADANLVGRRESRRS